MAKYLKIVLLFIFVTAPALDIAFLDAREAPDHFSEAYHDVDNQTEESAVDLHCICHVIHQGVPISKTVFSDVSDKRFKTRSVADMVWHGQNPKPGLHPPLYLLS